MNPGWSFFILRLNYFIDLGVTYAIKIIAPSLAAGMLALVIIDWLFVYLNLRDWFSFIEIDIQNKLKKIDN